MGKKSLLVGLAVAVTLLFSAVRSEAALVKVGDKISFQYAPGNLKNYSGGEFAVTVNGKGPLFDTFCLEYNEHIGLGTKYTVDSIGLGAINGGIAGGNPDPISSQTAWLYSNFFHKTLAGYDSSNGLNQKSLQYAFWVLEEERTLKQVPTDVKTAVNDWIALANQNANGGFYDARVINPVTLDKQGKIVAYNQSVLGVPEPGTLGLLGLGLTAMAFVSRRRRS